jgi:hypothetical protein
LGRKLWLKGMLSRMHDNIIVNYTF